MTLTRFRLLLRRAGVVLLLAVLAGTVNLAVAVAQDAGQTELDPQLVERGNDLFQTNCAMCHGDRGEGLDQEGPVGGPSLQDVGPASVDFMLRTGRMPMENQHARLRRGPPKFDETDRAALVAYVSSLVPGQQGPGIPDIDGWQSADLSTGMEQFTTNCAACHGPTAGGIAVGQNDVSSNLDVASPVEIAEAIRTGPGVMPVFGKDVLDEQDLEAVTAWVMRLRDRPSPGGISIGRSGPVSEGFIAWLVGMGLLGVVMYLLGDKAGDTEATDHE